MGQPVHLVYPVKQWSKYIIVWMMIKGPYLLNIYRPLYYMRRDIESILTFKTLQDVSQCVIWTNTARYWEIYHCK
jgi:hypothetical protein